MHYVILRDDDTNALTPVECLEYLYRPFLDRNLPVNLAVIPRVRTDAVRADGQREGFLFNGQPRPNGVIPISENNALVTYLRNNRGYHIAQHGCDHTFNEFDSEDSDEIRDRLEQGLGSFTEAGLAKSKTFIAPYDKYSKASLREIARRFRVFSTGWFELRRLPTLWWPLYALKKMLRRPHWRIGRTLLLSHPGCLLSSQRPREGILEEIKAVVSRQQLTVLVTHWWEYFRGGKPDEPFIRVLHETADWLAGKPTVKMISFDDLANGKMRRI